MKNCVLYNRTVIMSVTSIVSCCWSMSWKNKTPWNPSYSTIYVIYVRFFEDFHSKIIENLQKIYQFFGREIYFIYICTQNLIIAYNETDTHSSSNPKTDLKRLIFGSEAAMIIEPVRPHS